VALESALKIEETTYVRAKAFATSDFHHGPMAILQQDMPVIIYAPSGPSLSDMREMISLLKEAQADVLIVSDNKELCMTGDCHIIVPDAGSDFISPFVNSVVAQMFACELARIKGLNPDAPRMLHKVTITV
jgi:glucosamine--fructose-6-phosphate aminotransferase (isomerizing)